MHDQSTALVALNSISNYQNLSRLLGYLKVATTNKTQISTKENILLEVETNKPNYLFVSSTLSGIIRLEEVIARIKEISPRTKVILTVSENDEAGVLGYFLTNVDAIVSIENVFECLEFLLNQLAKGNLFICPITATELRVLLQQQKLETKFDLGLLALLTDRETEILHYLTQGVNYKQISKQLFISESTVKTHINNIFTKLNVNDRTQAVLYALRHGIETIIKQPNLVKNLNEAVQK